jgi:signal recognition particle GTPase
MLKSISNKFANLFLSTTTFDGSKLDDFISQVRQILFEADVSVTTVKKIVEEIKIEIEGQQISKKVEFAEFLMKTLYEKIHELIGKNKSHIVFDASKKPNVIMLVGL